MKSDPALRIEGLSKTFGANRALSSVDLIVERGEVHALLGENGSGKSTLIKILSGYHVSDPGGKIFVDGKLLRSGYSEASYEAGLRFVHQNLGLVDSSSVADNLSFNCGFPTHLATVSGRKLRKRSLNELEYVGLNVDPDALVSSLSAAERTGVAVARALQSENMAKISLLVLDEATAALPENEVQRIVGFIKGIASSGTGVLYVTHRLEEVFTAASVATVLRDGREIITTPVSSLTRSSLVNYLVGGEFDPVQKESAALEKGEGQSLLGVNSLHSDELDGISLEVRSGEVVGIVGITGSGREQICGMIFGAAKTWSGSVTIDGTRIPPNRPDLSIRAGAAFIPANRQRDGGFMELNARENFSISNLSEFWHALLLSRKAERTETKSWFDRMSVRPFGAIEQRFGSFSGGNQQKVIFAKWFRREPRLFLLDEPTQGVDVATKAFLHHQLLQAAGAGAGVLLSSSDIDEVVALCQRVLVFRNGKIATELVGDAITAANVSSACIGVDEIVSNGVARS